MILVVIPILDLAIFSNIQQGVQDGSHNLIMAIYVHIFTNLRLFKFAYLENVVPVRITQIPDPYLRAHVPPVEWRRCVLQSPTVQHQARHCRHRVPAQTQTREPVISAE